VVASWSAGLQREGENGYFAYIEDSEGNRIGLNARN